MSIKQSAKDEITQNVLFQESVVGQALKSNPLGFIDVGARGGAHDIVDPIAGLTAVLGFEPDLAECDRLMKIPEVYSPWANFFLEPVAVLDKIADAELHLLSANTNHSLLPPNKEYVDRYRMDKWREVGKETLKTNLIDHVIYSEKFKDYLFGEFIKLDTQGTEYEVLKGADRMLSERTVALVVEVAFCELYQGQKLFSDVELLLRAYGFSFYGFSKIHGRSCKLLNKKVNITAERAFYADAIFFKDPLPGASNRKYLSDRGIYGLFTCALLLGYYDFALELASKTFADSQTLKEPIESLIKTLSHYEPVNSLSAAKKLSDDLSENPNNANIIVGGFVDRRRHLCNYDDVLNISVLPKTL